MSTSTSTRLFQAAAALSAVLHAHNIGHAFHGGLLTVMLGSPRPSEVPRSMVMLDNRQSADMPPVQELFCIVEGSGSTHPFRRVRQALAGNEVLTATLIGWSNRLAAFMLLLCGWIWSSGAFTDYTSSTTSRFLPSNSKYCQRARKAHGALTRRGLYCCTTYRF
jgi:hypothetical protein